MSWRTLVQDYLTFSKTERIAAICVLVVFAAVYFLPKMFAHNGGTMAIKADTALLQTLDTIQQQKSTSPEENVSFSFYEPSEGTAGFTEGQLFSFDPNTLPAEGWQKLGLNQRTIRTIHNYRSKGGRFYKKEDLKKIWGLPDAFYNRVSNYIQIENARPQYHNTYTAPAYTPAKGKRSISVVAVNEADTTELIALPGIGSKLASRIINFRDKLGGFYSTDQIGETYGLPDSTFQMLRPYLQVNAAAVKKINLNTATKDELRAHPYIKWQLANAIVEYRARHGAFNSIEDLKNIMLVDEVTFQKIAPYFAL